MPSHLPHSTPSRISSTTFSTLFLKEIAATEGCSLGSFLAELSVSLEGEGLLG